MLKQSFKITYFINERTMSLDCKLFKALYQMKR